LVEQRPSELGLTTREREVLSWLSKGKTNRDIAQILGLSPRTVDKHLEQIYAKLGVENRTAAHCRQREPAQFVSTSRAGVRPANMMTAKYASVKK
jgi:DNA-binding CsgD family transcriptional regulator